MENNKSGADLLLSETAKKASIQLEISSEEKWVSIAERLHLQDQQPMIFDLANQNPFGSTLLYSFQSQVVFEISKSSGHIVSVTFAV